MRKLFEIGGLVAAAILIAFGVAAIVMGVDGRSTVETSLTQEKIVGSPDMTPDLIRAEAKEAGLPADLDYPTESVAGLEINTGDRARAFAGYMRIHALEATGGFTYAEMGIANDWMFITRMPRSTKPLSTSIATSRSDSTTGAGIMRPRRRRPSPEARALL